MAHSPFLAFMSLLAATLAWAPNGIMYSYPATFLQGAAAATGVALINSIANIGGMIGPYLIGRRARLSALLISCHCGQKTAVQLHGSELVRERQSLFDCVCQQIIAC